MENIMSSKLFTTRQGTVLLGVIAAVIAAIALLVYLNHYKNSVVKPNVSVLVATKLIQTGTPGDVLRANPGYYKLTSLPAKSVQTGAIVDPATLAGKVVIAPNPGIAGGQQLTAADFGPGTGLASELNPKQRAVVIALGSPQEVGGQIGPGSHVDFWLTTSGQGNGVAHPVAKLLFQDLYVLAVSGGNVTLRTSPTQAGQIIYASSNDQIWLVLRPTVAPPLKKPPTIGSVGG